MDFAPYQDTSPETSRALSPPPPQRSSSRSPAPKSPPPNRPNPPPNRPSTDPFSSTLLPPPSHFSDEPRSNGALETGRANVNLFETSLPLRLDYEAMLAYLLLPPAGGVFLLVMERKSDYVRFHAWQSSMLFASIFVLHLILSWSSVLSWMLFAMDVCLIGFLSFRAHRDVDMLDRFEVPVFGRLASRFVDAE